MATEIDANKNIIHRKLIRIDFFDIFFMVVALAFWISKLYTHTYLLGMPISTMSNLIDSKPVDPTNAALGSANLPGHYVCHILYKYLGIPDNFIKSVFMLFVIVVGLSSIYKTSILVFKNKLCGIFAIIILLFSSLFYSVSAPAPFVENNVQTIATILTVLAVFFWLKGKYGLSALVVAAAFDWHPIYSIGFIIVFFLDMLIRYRKISRKTILLSFAIFAFVTLPVAFSIFKSAFLVFKGMATQAIDSELIWRYVRLAQPEHAFLAIKPEFHIGISLYIASLLLLLSSLFNEKNIEDKVRFIKLFFLILTTILFALFDNLNSYYFKVIPLFNLKLARFTSYGSMMVYSVLAGFLWYSARTKNNVNIILRGWLFVLLCLSVLDASQSYTSMWFYHLLILECVIIFYCFNAFHKTGDKLMAGDAIVRIGLLLLSLGYFYYLVLFSKDTHNIAFFKFFTLEKLGLWWTTLYNVHFSSEYVDGNVLAKCARVTTVAALSLMCCYYIIVFLRRSCSHFRCCSNTSSDYTRGYFSRIMNCRSTIVTVLLTGVFVFLSYVGLERAYGLEDYRNNIIYKYEMPMKDWVRVHTPGDSKFLIPFYINSWFDTNRYAFYDVNIANNASYNKVYIMEAIRNFEILMNIDLKRMSKAEMNKISPLDGRWGARNDYFKRFYDNLSENRVLQFHRDFGIDYFVTGSRKRYPFTVVYCNDEFIIYRLKQGTALE